MSKPLKRDQPDDRALVEDLKKGDPEAYRVLVETYQPRVFNIAYGITLDREASLELAQDVFLTVYRKISGFRHESTLATWLHRITVNLSLNRLRRWKRRFRNRHQPMEGEAVSPADWLQETETPETRLRQKEFHRLFQEQLRALPQKARAILVMKEAQGMSYEEIAEILKISKGTVSSRLFYARRKLKTALEQYMQEEGLP